MHSVNAILAQTTIRFESNASKIIHPYWRCNLDSIRRVSFAQYLLDKLSGNHSQQKIIEYETQNTCTYEDLGHYIRQAATLLNKHISAGEFIVFIGPNSFEYLALYFGAICNGAIPMNLPCNNNSLQDIRTFIIQHSVQYLVMNIDHGNEFDLVVIRKLLNSITQIKKIFLYGCVHTNDDSIDNEKIVHLGDWLNSNLNEINQLYKPINVVTVPCLAFNSNGTHQWPPRLFIHNHFSLVATSETIADGRIFEFRSIDKLLVYGSFEHLENILMFISAIVNGCSFVLLPSYDYVHIIDAIVRYRIYLAILPSNFLIKLLKDTGHNVKLEYLIKIIAFGGKISTILCQKFFHRFPNVRSIRHCYLMAETPTPITMLIRNSNDYDSAGFPLPNTQIKIHSLFDYDDEMLEANCCGLIAIGRERNMFAIGYLSNNSSRIMELNFQQTMNQSTADEHCHHRWLITQDIGFYDENGLIYLHGQYRYSSMELISIVQQSRIESYLLNHPLIAEAYVIETTTGKCAALVALKFVNTHLTPELNQQIVDYIKENVADLDEFFLFVQYNIPKTNCGRYIDCLIRKEIFNLINLEKKF
ncbi:uncharacterized protein LOC124496373 isoform X1 [Dermatophagoides farinae]|uniref:uncharacterized protein LOC124496373 isoform X1 n=1 Tax=Dermatophagoides farinae TaxID=6954 RepID=UPI003F629C5E